MANIHSFYCFVEHDFSAEEILEALKISCPKGNLNRTFDNETRTINITGPEIDYDITFQKKYFTVTKKFPTYKIIEYHDYKNFKFKEEAHYYVGDDTLVLEQINLPEALNETNRSLYVIKPDEDKSKATFTKKVIFHTDTGYLETYEKVKRLLGSKDKRRIRLRPSNIIINNTDKRYIAVGEKNAIARTTTTFSNTGINLYYKLNLPSNHCIDDISSYGVPSIMIDGKFIDIPSEEIEEPGELSFKFFVFKARDVLQFGIDYKTGEDGQKLLRSYQTNKDPFMNVNDLGLLIDRIKEEKFLELPVEYPLEHRIIEELMRLRIELFINVVSPEKGIDFLDFNLIDHADFCYKAFHIYENLTRYYEEALKNCDVNKAEKIEV